MASGDGGGITVALEWLDEIEARANVATPGPWEAFEMDETDDGRLRSGPWWVWQPDTGDHVFDGINTKREDAEFAAAARTDVPLLCRAVRELVGALELSIRVMDAGSLMGVEERLSLKWAVSRTLERWQRGGA